MAGFGVIGCLLPGSPAPSLTPRTLDPNLPGTGLGAYRGPPIMLLDNLGPPRDGLFWGVEPAFCVFRNGDSGRGNDGRFDFKVGLVA